MTTYELISYIRKQIKNNTPKDLIISKLTGAGWHIEDIDEGFSSVELEFKLEIPLSDTKKEIDNINPIKNKQDAVDWYREPLVEDSIIEIKKELPKIEILNTEEQKQETKKIETPKMEVFNIKTPKVWIPMSVPVKEKSPTENDGLKVREETTQIIIQNPELQIKKPVRNVESIASAGGEDKLGQPKEVKNFGKNKTLDIINPKYFNKKEELIPTLIPKIVVNSFGSINKGNLIKSDSPIVSDEPSKNSLIKNLPKMAMLSSYKSDLSSINKIKEETVKHKRDKLVKWFIVVLVVFIIALATWAFASGYINIKNLNISFIKKDPKVLLLSNSKVLSSLKSYKTETNIKISSPSFANITSGLISGEAIPSLDKDSISINTLGMIYQNEKGLLSDNFVTIKSSILQDYITTDIKNDGSDLFISVPDLSQVIKENAPEPSVVKINEGQFELIPPLFSPNIELALKKINIYKILSSGMPSYINNETLSAYDELINNVEILEKGQENIKGIDTYHYSINADRQLAKKLLSKISDNFVLNLSNDDKDRLAQILGSVTIDSFDVWIGKGDNNIYQYSVVLDIPLSKIIGFEDKSIGDNQINIDWKTTYYDFNISNNVFMPEESILVTNFVNSIKKTKIKNDVSSFEQLATNLSKAEGVYGSKSNSSGSCMNPSSGSLFSPISHSKGATTAVSSISGFLNKILGTTNGAGSCYSTSKDWSFAVPISDNYDPSSISAGGYTSFFCVDSTGSTKDLTTLPTGVICK